MNYNRKIRKLKKLLNGKHIGCVGFLVNPDGSIKYAINGNYDTESKNLDLYSNDISSVLGPKSSSAKITVSFSFFITISRFNPLLKLYEDFFYYNLDMDGQFELAYFIRPMLYRYNPILNINGNFNCVERKLIPFSEPLSCFYVSLKPCYFCLASFPKLVSVTYCDYNRNFRDYQIATIVRNWDGIYFKTK